ncbi:fungal protease inhibitor-1 [Bicyclus anynana]|uniref:Fungal protease inhibitor-1 n=1 Tax=Bicyclus anynana TaxID=110368 RepID=A0A6J1P026_BICAN|nr:fungal protease inhibitor-1 [Bicyclus anynana]
MKAALILAIVACALTLVYGDFVCGTNYCKEHPCTTKIASSSCRAPSTYRDLHSGKCACCPACVTLLSEGAACKKYSKEIGETPSAVCKEPLKCLTGVCTKVTPRG